MYCHYDENGNCASKTHNSDLLKAQIKLAGRDSASEPCLVIPEGAPDATRGKITSITAYRIDLPANVSKHTKEVQTHQFIRVKTDQRFALTLEKDKTCILVQSCRYHDELTMPIVARKNGKERPRIESLCDTVTDENPKQCSIEDIVKWIHEKKLLKRTYHLARDNCQHFTTELWTRISSVPYPSPSQYAPAGSSPSPNPIPAANREGDDWLDVVPSIAGKRCFLNSQ